jgi:ABC-type multidrug transport system permease subunit
MAKDVEVGVVGSLTMIVLFSSVYFLLRNFYKRFNRLQEKSAPFSENEDKD